MFDALKVKPYDLEPVYVSWPDAPVFSGNGKDDPAEWLEQIKAGCKERKVPKEYWHRVGRHFMGQKPRERLDELGKVMSQMTGNKAHWDWKKFKIAVQNLGWGPGVTGPKSKTPTTPPISQRPMPKKQGSWWVLGKADTPDKENELIVAKAQSSSPPQTPPPYCGQLVTMPMPSGPPSPQMLPPDAGQITTISKAPAWLVNACQAMDFLTQEHPRVMSAMSAILLTIGAIPAIPAISAGAGGALLASGAVQAAGAVAIGVGQALKAMQSGQVKVDTPAVQA